IFHFLQTMDLPIFFSLQAQKHFVKQSLQFFLKGDSMFKCCHSAPPLKVIFNPDLRLHILTEAHKRLGHRGVNGVFSTVREHFYWLHMLQDVKHHVCTCHECQI
ncbi:hypothetical protein SERLADRAFT_351677, partial [Serpula lacrymans var. lacrymans S7.9]